MARANYRFDKRQRELTKLKKKEEKRLKKEARKAAGVDEFGNPLVDEDGNPLAAPITDAESATDPEPGSGAGGPGQASGA